MKAWQDVQNSNFCNLKNIPDAKISAGSYDETMIQVLQTYPSPEVSILFPNKKPGSGYLCILQPRL